MTCNVIKKVFNTSEGTFKDFLKKHILLEFSYLCSSLVKINSGLNVQVTLTIPSTEGLFTQGQMFVFSFIDSNSQVQYTQQYKLVNGDVSDYTSSVPVGGNITHTMTLTVEGDYDGIAYNSTLSYYLESATSLLQVTKDGSGEIAAIGRSDGAGGITQSIPFTLTNSSGTCNATLYAGNGTLQQIVPMAAPATGITVYFISNSETCYIFFPDSSSTTTSYAIGAYTNYMYQDSYFVIGNRLNNEWYNIVSSISQTNNNKLSANYNKSGVESFHLRSPIITNYIGYGTTQNVGTGGVMFFDNVMYGSTSGIIGKLDMLLVPDFNILNSLGIRGVKTINVNGRTIILASNYYSGNSLGTAAFDITTMGSGAAIDV